jgi:hypothetical protein
MKQLSLQESRVVSGGADDRVTARNARRFRAYESLMRTAERTKNPTLARIALAFLAGS